MIALNRIRHESAIDEKYRGAKKQAADLNLLLMHRKKLQGKITKLDFDEDFWKASKDQLKQETYGKCAYCESPTDVVAYGDVEHYRPKSVYWWLAYTYDNYLYSCQLCNQKYKSDNFPTQGKRLSEPAIQANMTDAQLKKLLDNISPDPLPPDKLAPAIEQYKQNHLKERPFLLDPYLDKPESVFAYAANDVLEEVLVTAQQPQYVQFLNAAETYVGINRPELKRQRYLTYKIFRFVKLQYKMQTGDSKLEAQKLLNVMLNADYPFAGMCRYFNEVL